MDTEVQTSSAATRFEENINRERDNENKLRSREFDSPNIIDSEESPPVSGRVAEAADLVARGGFAFPAVVEQSPGTSEGDSASVELEPSEVSGSVKAMTRKRRLRFLLPPVVMESLSGTTGRATTGQVQLAVSSENLRGLVRIQARWRGSQCRRRLKLSRVVHGIFDPYFEESPVTSPTNITFS